MAKKATITPVTDTVNNASAINTQLNAINNQLDNTLSLDGSTPNAMNADIDLNSNDLLNVGTLQTNDITVAGDSLTGVLASTGANKDAAAASAASASTSATAASLSATQAAQFDGPWLDDVTALLADTALTYTAGQPSTVVAGGYVRTRSEGFSYEVADAGATDQDVTTTGGVKLYVKQGVLVRNALNAATLASLPDGAVRFMGGVAYVSDSTKTGASSCTNDLLVDGLAPSGVATIGHYGGDPTGVADSSPALERAFVNHYTVDGGGPENTWLMQTQVGIPDQNFYTPQSYRLIADGARMVVAGVDRLFTSAGFKAAPTSTANLFVGKGEVTGFNFTQTSACSIFDGDHLYNWYIHHNNFYSISKIIYSGAAKVGYPDGYLQSISFCSNNVASCAWVVDAKRAFNCTFNNNMFEACSKGIYIDGLGQPAINGLTVRYNVFEGSAGLFLKLGDFIGLDVGSNYLEKNTGGDVDTFKCYIYVTGAGSQQMTGVFEANHGQLTAPQIADAAFELIKFVSLTLPLTNLRIVNTWTNGKLFTDNRVLHQSGNKGAVAPLAPRSTQVSRFDYQSQRVSATYAANRAGAVLTICKFTLPEWDTTTQTVRPFSANLSCMVHLLTNSSVMVGGNHFDINLLVMGSEGTSGNTKMVGASLVSHTAIPSGYTINPGVPTGVTVSHFSAPALTVTEAAGVFSINLSGFSSPAAINFGASTQFVNSINVTINAQNRDDFAASRVGQFVLTS
jgi:hypothetical protein